MKRLATISTVLVLFLLFVPIGFVGIKCFSTKVHPDNSDQENQNVVPEVKGYAREGSATYLTLPEWYIVYSTEEYAGFIKDNPPSSFPYFDSIRQYWEYYGNMCGVTKAKYPFNAGVHLMLNVIGMSFSIENALKGLYENTLGRVTEFISGHDTEEDTFAYRTATEYGRFMHMSPWYEFPFANKFGELWSRTSLLGPHFFRKCERKAALSTEYGAKALYGWIIKKSTGAVYDSEDVQIHARVEHTSEMLFSDSRIRKVKEISPGSYVVTMPRYEEFTEVVVRLVEQGVRFHDIAGNEEILITAIASRNRQYSLKSAKLIFSKPTLTHPDVNRLAVNVPVASLHATITQLQTNGIRVEHIYDY